jgi:hypothetical protein
MYEDSSEIRKTTSGATSSARPVRPSGVCAMFASRNQPGADAVMGVSMYPGRIVLTRIPRAPSSRPATRDSPLADAVGGGVVSRQARDRAHVDDRSARRHERGDGLDAEQAAREVDREHAIPVGDLDLEQPHAERDGGVVDEAVDAPVRLFDPRSELAPVAVPRDIEATVDDAVAEVRILFPQIGRDHRCALASERLGLGGTLTSGRSRDDDDLAFDAAHVVADTTGFGCQVALAASATWPRHPAVKLTKA